MTSSSIFASCTVNWRQKGIISLSLTIRNHSRFTVNYMAYRGNQLRFGKLTMSDTDMVLIDMDPKDPFDFYLDHYRDQLVAGYTKMTPEFGLRVFMRDFHKLHRAPSTRR